MKHFIYYFSGTGNSYWVAQKINNKLTDAELLNISDFTNNDSIQIKNCTLGIIFPLYYYGLPHIIVEFLKKINLKKIDYCYIVITAMYPNGLGIQQVENILNEKKIQLNSGFYVKMPTNFTIKYNAPEKKMQNKIIKSAVKKINNIIINIKTFKNKKDKESKLYNYLLKTKSSYYAWFNECYDLDRNFSLNNNCNSCGLCLKKCPKDNINFANNKPQWMHNCEFCLCCFNICPQNAILYNNGIVSKRRYKGIS